MTKVFYIITRNGKECRSEMYTDYKAVVARCEHLKKRSNGFSTYGFNTHYQTVASYT